MLQIENGVAGELLINVFRVSLSLHIVAVKYLVHILQ